MKKIFVVLLTVILLINSVCFLSFGAGYYNNNIVSDETPKTTATAKLLWSKKLGSGYRNSPTPPTVVADTIIVASGNNLFKINKSTGEVIANATLCEKLSFSTVPVTYGSGKIFVPIGNGKIQAFDYKTMKSLWVYTDSLGGQCLTAITYSGGYIYSGFWNGEEKNANFVCLSVKDENAKNEKESKKATWTYKNNGGYYGSSAVINGDFAYFGSDNGATSASEKSKLRCVNRLTGKLVSYVTLTGDLRSATVFESSLSRIFVSSKAGYVYSVKVNSSTGKFSASSLMTYKAGGAVTGTPVIYNNRLYVGSQNGQNGYLRVVDAKTMKIIYSVEMKGYPQSTVLVSNAYEKETGKIYIYSTYNATPGGITVIEDSSGQTKPLKSELFSPTDDASQYCISSIVSDSDGTLYYKNDSGYIFVVAKKSANIFTYIIELINSFLRTLGSVLGS